MVCRNCSNSVVDGTTTCPRCGKNPYRLLGDTLPVVGDAPSVPFAGASEPIIVPHRMGGSSIAPDNILASAEAAVSRGFQFIDGGDYYNGADGTLLCSHESITTTYLQGNPGVAVNISDHTAQSWRNVLADPGRYFLAPGWDALFPVASMDEVFRWAANAEVAITPELKAYTPANVTKMTTAIKRYGLGRSALFTSFSVAACRQAKEEGCLVGLIIQDESNPLADILSLRPDYCSYILPTLSDAYLKAIIAGGVKLGYLADRQSDLAAEQARVPISMVHTNEPGLLRGDTTLADTFKSLTWPDGVRPSHVNSGYRGEVTPTGKWKLANGLYWVLHGWGRLVNTLEFDVTWDQIPADTNQYIGIAFGCVDDKSFSDSSTNKSFAYYYVHRANGGLSGWKRTADTGGGNATATQVANTLASTPPTQGQTIRYRLEMYPPGFPGAFRFTRLDTNTVRFIPETLSLGPYFHLGHSPGFDCTFGNIVTF